MINPGDDLILQLTADRVCDIGTVKIRYGLDREGALLLIRSVRGYTHDIAVPGRGDHFGSFVLCTAVSLRRRYFNQQDSTLRHYCGLARMRYEMQAPPETYSHESDHAKDHYGSPYTYPDAYSERADGRTVWVEYDNGNYGKEMRRLKIQSAIDKRAPLWWGDASDQRIVMVAQQIARAFELNEESDQRKGRIHRHPLEYRCLHVPWHRGSEVDIGAEPVKRLVTRF